MEDKLEYFIEQTNHRLEKMDQKLDDLLGFKWQIIGGATFLSIVASVALQILFN